MDFNDYQDKAKKFAFYPKHVGMSYILFGLTSEVGEVCDKFKKSIRDGQDSINSESCAAIKKEMGDVLWYLSMLAEEMGFKLDDVAKLNLQKLQKRKEDGTLKGSGDDR